MDAGPLAGGAFAPADQSATLDENIGRLPQPAYFNDDCRQHLPRNAYCRFGKRAFDMLFSTLVLAGGSCLYVLIAAAVKLDSPGPVLFRQKRIGLDGVPFDCLKFRTMQHAPQAAFCQAQKDDPRVTRVGRLLRKTNLDELPQFINVLRGEMSVVGPRPHVPELDGDFAGRVPGYTRRTRVRPGITGLAQVCGRRGETRKLADMRQRVRLDLFYTRNAGLLFDLKIVAATARNTLLGDLKAY